MFRTDELTESVRLMFVAQSAGSEERDARTQSEPFVTSVPIGTGLVTPVVTVATSPGARVPIGEGRAVGLCVPGCTVVGTGRSRANDCVGR